MPESSPGNMKLRNDAAKTLDIEGYFQLYHQLNILPLGI
jgi:hypothetical protein